jgi:hypothetical protein
MVHTFASHFKDNDPLRWPNSNLKKACVGVVLYEEWCCCLNLGSEHLLESSTYLSVDQALCSLLQCYVVLTSVA